MASRPAPLTPQPREGSGLALSVRGALVKKASEYRQHAEECRTLARMAAGEQREQLLRMAETWDRLAADRSDLIRRHPELAMDGEQAEESTATRRTG
jgi:hypothetical protein